MHLIQFLLLETVSDKNLDNFECYGTVVILGVSKVEFSRELDVLNNSLWKFNYKLRDDQRQVILWLYFYNCFIPL